MLEELYAKSKTYYMGDLIIFPSNIQLQSSNINSCDVFFGILLFMGRCITKKKLYNNFQEVVDLYRAVIKLIDSGDKMKVDQSHLETVIPAQGLYNSLIVQ